MTSTVNVSTTKGQQQYKKVINCHPGEYTVHDSCLWAQDWLSRLKLSFEAPYDGLSPQAGELFFRRPVFVIFCQSFKFIGEGTCNEPFFAASINLSLPLQITFKPIFCLDLWDAIQIFKLRGSEDCLFSFLISVQGRLINIHAFQKVLKLAWIESEVKVRIL